MKKLLITLLVALITGGVITSTSASVYASEGLANDLDNEIQEPVINEEEMKEQAISNLKFYLEDAGYIDPITHQYIPTDILALREKAQLSGAEGQSGQFIYENFVLPYLEDNLQKYAVCVVMNSLPFGGIVWDALEGNNAVQILINALQGANYDKAVDLLIDIAKKTLTPSQFAKFNVVTIAASVAINAVSCWGN